MKKTRYGRNYQVERRNFQDKQKYLFLIPHLGGLPIYFMFKNCSNCNAVISKGIKKCPVCNLNFTSTSGEVILFTEEARFASDGLGGLLQILPVEGKFVCFIAKCTGGFFGINRAGELVWRVDWLYIASFVYEHGKLRVNGILVDIDTGFCEFNN